MAVLVGVDGSAGSQAAVDWAAGESAVTGVPLQLVYAAWPAGESTGAAVLERARRQVLRDYPGLSVGTTVSAGRPGQALTERPASQIVVGRRGAGGFSRLPLGSAALEVAGCSAAPVVVVPETSHPDAVQPGAAGGILLAVDTTAPDPVAMRFAFDRALTWARPLRVLTVWQGGTPAGAGGIRQAWQQQEDQACAALRAAVLPWASAYPDVGVDQVVRYGHPAGTILEHQDEVTLLVLGRGGGLSGIGAIARSVLQLAGVPVAVVPAAPAGQPPQRQHQQQPSAREVCVR